MKKLEQPSSTESNKKALPKYLGVKYEDINMALANAYLAKVTSNAYSPEEREEFLKLDQLYAQRFHDIHVKSFLAGTLDQVDMPNYELAMKRESQGLVLPYSPENIA